MPVHGTGAYYFEHGPTGPVSTEDFAEMLRRMGYDTGLDVEKLMEAGGRAELPRGIALPTGAQLSSQVEAALAEAAEAGGHHPIL